MSESQKTETHSEKQGKEAQENASVYDFLYHDARRIASFLSQFHKYGVLAGSKSTEERESLGATLTSGNVSASVPTVFQGGGALSQNRQDRDAEKLEQSYDPLWTNAMAFLDYLEGAGLIFRRAEDAQIGQVVSVTGDAVVFDLSLIQRLWGNSLLSVNNLAKSVPRTEGHDDKQHKDSIRAALEFIKGLPHVLQISVKTPENQFWGILNEQNMVTSSTDILLKNGGILSGKWTMLGVLDAFPDSSAPDPANTLEAIGAYGDFISKISPIIRRIVGRPQEAYGVTPLVILREVSASS